ERAARLTSHSVSSLCFSPDSIRLVWLEYEPNLQLWDLRHSQKYRCPPAQMREHILGLAFLNRDHLVLNGVKLFPEICDVTTGEKVFAFESSKFVQSMHRFEGGLLALSADGTWLAQSGFAPRVWDLESQQLLFLLPDKSAYPWSLAWSPNKEHLAAGF